VDYCKTVLVHYSFHCEYPIQTEALLQYTYNGEQVNILIDIFLWMWLKVYEKMKLLPDKYHHYHYIASNVDIVQFG